VLDLFCNQGGFALNAAKGGAASVVAVDISETALNAVKRNSELNGLDNLETHCAAVFEFLREAKKSGAKYDVIILDPTAFTKTADKLPEAIRGYRDLNTSCLRLLSEGGVLVTNSCSQHVTVPIFLNMLKDSAISASVPARLLEFRTQSPDHAPLLASEEGLYLKTAVVYK